MPLYEYRCPTCGHHFEKIKKFSDNPAEPCPQCGNEEALRLIGAPAIRFKGGGWYINDYAHGHSSCAGKADSADAHHAASPESAPSPSSPSPPAESTAAPAGAASAPATASSPHSTSSSKPKAAAGGA